jgi:rare lipoprotein A
MKLPIRISFASVAGLGLLSLGACASTAQTASGPVERSIANGPAADYPVVVGDPFTVDGITYTPVDTMNYDQVGYATIDEPGAAGVTGAHRTLPLPSYVEVTALDTGRTVLVRIERRGPMTNDRLVSLSEAALAQLGVGEGAPVRMRRVNPPEEQRAQLRAGGEAPPKMDTPAGLLEVLKRRLPERGSAPLGDARQAQISGIAPVPGAIATLDPDEEAAVAPTQDDPDSSPAPAEDTAVTRPELPMAVEGGPARAALMVPVTADGTYTVQLGAFSVRANADRLAREVQGYVETSGSLALVRVGPFATRGQAEQALAKLRERGYSDAEIRSLD